MRQRLICAWCRQRKKPCDLELLILKAHREGRPVRNLACARCAGRPKCDYEAPDEAALRRIAEHEHELESGKTRRRKREAAAAATPAPTPPDSMRSTPDFALPFYTPSMDLKLNEESILIPPEVVTHALGVYSGCCYPSIPAVDLNLLATNNPYDAFPQRASDAMLALALYCTSEEISFWTRHPDAPGAPDANEMPPLNETECVQLANVLVSRATAQLRTSLLPVPGPFPVILPDPTSLLWDALVLLHLTLIASTRNADRWVTEHFFRLAVSTASMLDPLPSTPNGVLARRIMWCLYACDRSGLYRASNDVWLVREEVMGNVPLSGSYGVQGSGVITLSTLDSPAAVAALFPFLDGLAMQSYLFHLASMIYSDPSHEVSALLDATESALLPLLARPSAASSAQAWTLLPDSATRFSHIQPPHLYFLLLTLRMLLHTPTSVRELLSPTWLASPAFPAALGSATQACEALNAVLESDPNADDAFPGPIWPCIVKIALVFIVVLRHIRRNPAAPELLPLDEFLESKLVGHLRTLAGLTGFMPALGMLAEIMTSLLAGLDGQGGVEDEVLQLFPMRRVGWFLI